MEKSVTEKGFVPLNERRFQRINHLGDMLPIVYWSDVVFAVAELKARFPQKVKCSEMIYRGDDIQKVIDEIFGEAKE